jgi:hypothetical protein
MEARRLTRDQIDHLVEYVHHVDGRLSSMHCKNREDLIRRTHQDRAPDPLVDLDAVDFINMIGGNSDE